MTVTYFVYWYGRKQSISHKSLDKDAIYKFSLILTHFEFILWTHKLLPLSERILTMIRWYLSLDFLLFTLLVKEGTLPQGYGGGRRQNTRPLTGGEIESRLSVPYTDSLGQGEAMWGLLLRRMNGQGLWQAGFRMTRDEMTSGSCRRMWLAMWTSLRLSGNWLSPQRKSGTVLVPMTRGCRLTRHLSVGTQ